VASQPGYDPENFQDMNQVARRGSNWRNLVSNGKDKSIEFSDGPYNCVAIHKAGTPWRGGYVYVLHAGICRTDTAGVCAEDVAYTLGSTQIRQSDPVNLGKAGERSGALFARRRWRFGFKRMDKAVAEPGVRVGLNVRKDLADRPLPRRREKC
jgi:hypothetical protein